MIDLIPPAETVMKILTDAGAYRYGNFSSPNGRHSSHLFRVPLAFHYYDNARVLAVGLSRKFRMDKTVSSRLPRISVVSASTGGMPVAFSFREALNAEQIYWTERENGALRFPDHMDRCELNPCIIVDDIVRSGRTMREAYDLVTGIGVEVIGCGAIIRFDDGPAEIDSVKVKSLVEFHSPVYDSREAWQAAEGNHIAEEVVEGF